MHAQAASKKAKFLGGAPDSLKPEGSVWEKVEDAGKAVSRGGAGPDSCVLLQFSKRDSLSNEQLGLYVLCTSP